MVGGDVPAETVLVVAIASAVLTVVPLSVMLEADTQAPTPPPLMSTFAAIAAEAESVVEAVKQGIAPETPLITAAGNVSVPLPPPPGCDWLCPFCARRWSR